jgi:aminopeptidase-like protein
LNFSDGTRSLLDIAERSGMPFWLLHEGAQRLIETGLLRELNEEAA